MKILIDATGGYEDWWPVGRRLLPVQFYKFKSGVLFERTLKIALELSSEIFVLCDEWNKFYVYEGLEKAGIKDYESMVCFDRSEINGEFLFLPSTLFELDVDRLKSVIREGIAVYTKSAIPKPGILHLDPKSGRKIVPINARESDELLKEGWVVFTGIYYGEIDENIKSFKPVIVENVMKIATFLDLSLLKEDPVKRGDNWLIYSERYCVSDGVENLILLDMEDLTFVSSYENFKGASKFYKNVKEKELEVSDVHKTAYRPWGSYTVLEEGEGFKVKRITVKPGKRLSLQLHHHRSEHWTVVKGTAKVTVGEKEILMKPGDHVFIPVECVHRLENPGKIPLEVIEVQVGDYLGEDDIVRIEDDFKRI